MVKPVKQVESRIARDTLYWVVHRGVSWTVLHQAERQVPLYWGVRLAVQRGVWGRLGAHLS